MITSFSKGKTSPNKRSVRYISLQKIKMSAQWKLWCPTKVRGNLVPTTPSFGRVFLEKLCNLRIPVTTFKGGSSVTSSTIEGVRVFQAVLGIRLNQAIKAVVFGGCTSVENGGLLENRVPFQPGSLEFPGKEQRLKFDASHRPSSKKAQSRWFWQASVMRWQDLKNSRSTPEDVEAANNKNGDSILLLTVKIWGFYIVYIYYIFDNQPPTQDTSGK